MAVAAMIGPAVANAATVTVTGDAGAPVALGGPVAIRYLNPEVTVTPAAGEWVGFDVTGPTGAAASPGLSCVDPGGNQNLVNYFGNGVYTVQVQRYQANSSGTFCNTSAPIGGPVPFQFTINAAVAIDQAPANALTRKPLSPVTTDAPIHVNVNPGGIGNQVFYGFNSQIAPDGSLATPAGQVLVDPNTGAAIVSLNKGPGVYTVVGRAEGFNIAGDIFTAWSPPVSIRAFAPFDLKSLAIPDNRGPSYRVRARMGENATSGRVSIAIARGSKGGRYRSLGSVKIRGHQVTKRFNERRTGTYRIRFKYKGNALVASGFQVNKVRITRRITFRSAAAQATATAGVRRERRTGTHQWAGPQGLGP